MSALFSGIGVSRGVVIGRVQKLAGGDFDIPECVIEPTQIDSEIARYLAAVELARSQLRDVRAQIPSNTPPEIAAFIDTHLLMLQDSSLSEVVVSLIREKCHNAEWALKVQRDSLMSVFDQMDDAYLKTRSHDIEHVTNRILRILLRHDRPLAVARKRDAEPIILVSDDITPADIILLHKQGIGGFITEFGGPLSHTAILARSLGIPTIVGLHHARRLLGDDEPVVLDGEKGQAIANPDAATLAFYQQRQADERQYRVELARLKGEPAISRDGHNIQLLANVELPADGEAAREFGAVGVGLYRTEFLYMNRRDMPGEEEQFEAYRQVLQAVKGPVTIRTLDLGADKQVDSGRQQGPTPNNPALGLRAIRLCLKEVELFRTQIRALLRASVEGQLKIMLPMISNLQELLQARSLIENVRAELRHAGQRVADFVPIGAMIEVPAAALAAPMLARHADFFSIGTNDLIQYTLAIDRVDDEVNYLYDPLHPAVIQLIRHTIEAGAAAGIPVAMCGEMAGDPRFTRLLLGLGLNEFSMHPASLLEVKRMVRMSDVDTMRQQVAEAMKTADATLWQDCISALTQDPV